MYLGGAIEPYLLTGCGGNFTARTGVITSLNYPNNYPHNTDCGWLITVEQGRTVTLTFDDLDVEEDEDCTFDYVAVSVHGYPHFAYCQ